MNEITLQLDTSGSVYLYEQIYEYIKTEIREGKRRQGERLPSTRVLAEYLQVSRSTVDLAYEQLLSEGYLEARPYKGYYVCRIEDLFYLPGVSGVAEKTEKKLHETVQDSKDYGSCQYDFSLRGIEGEGFPFAAWRSIYNNTLLYQGGSLFEMGDVRGEEKLRAAIARYLHSSRGAECDPGQIIIGAGNDYLLMLLEKILGSERRMAMENPTYQRAYRLFDACGYDLTTIPMDESGMRVDKLLESGADTAYVMPSHQYPTGIVMPIGRRMELLNWAMQKEGRYLIEDDYDSEFRYKGKPIPCLQGADKNGKVIYIGTFSKSIAPAIRISYMVLPDRLLAEYADKASFFASTVSRMDQLMLEEFIRCGSFEKHLNKMRKTYKAKHDLLLSCLKEMESEFRISGENAGLHLLLHHRGGKTEEELIAGAAREGVKVYGLSEARRGKGNRKEAVVLLGYGGLSEREITEGVKGLKKAWMT